MALKYEDQGELRDAVKVLPEDRLILCLELLRGLLYLYFNPVDLEECLLKVLPKGALRPSLQCFLSLAAMQ